MSKERSKTIKTSIHDATQSLLRTISTSFGPKGLDKMLIKDNKATVTNDGATILKFYTEHPIHKILSSVSSTQDSECGDGTTSVVMLVASLMEKVRVLIEMGIHPADISRHLENTKKISDEYIKSVRCEISGSRMFDSVVTSLNSKLTGLSTNMAEVAIRAMDIVNGNKELIKITKKAGGVVDDISVHKGMLFESDVVTEKTLAKVAVVQFCISPPKTNMDSGITISDPEQMEKIIAEERNYIMNMCKKIKMSGCNLLVMQKSILRDSLSDLAKHILERLHINVIKSVERKDIEYICSALNIRPVSDIEFLTKDAIKEVEIKNTSGCLEIMNYGCTILVRGCDDLVLDESERCLNDALSVVKCLKEEPYLVPGGGAIEMGISQKLLEQTEGNVFIYRTISEAFESIPYFLSRNAGLYPVDVISELRTKIKENPLFGVSVRGGNIRNMVEDDDVVQPAKVTRSMIMLAIESTIMMLKIDDMLPSIR